MPISSIDIINTPELNSHRKDTTVNFNVGDTLDMSRGNLLLTGESGTGKTILLRMLSQSFQRVQMTLDNKNPSNPQSSNLYNDFCLNGKNPEDDSVLIDAFESALLSVYRKHSFGHDRQLGGALTNIWSSEYFGDEEGVLESLDKIISEREKGSGVYEDYTSGLSKPYDGINKEIFMKAIKLSSQEYNVSEEVFYGNIIAILERKHGFETDAGRFAYTKFNGITFPSDMKGIEYFPQNTPLQYTSGESFEEVLKALEDESQILMAFLDNPTALIDTSTRCRFEDILKSPTNPHQIIMSSHDRQIIDIASKYKGWKVMDLGER